MTRKRLQHALACYFRPRSAKVAAMPVRFRSRSRQRRSSWGVLSADAERVWVSDGDSHPGGGGGGVRQPALRIQLYRLIDSARLNRLRASEQPGGSSSWSEDMQACTAAFSIVPGHPLSGLWFPRFQMWNRRWVHARVREATRNWPAGHEPQGFLYWDVWQVDAGGVGRKGLEDRVEVLSGVGRPIVHNVPVRPPTSSSARSVGRKAGATNASRDTLKPISLKDLPVPVDSDYERRALWTLRRT